MGNQIVLRIDGGVLVDSKINFKKFKPSEKRRLST